jgi:hypothetical protein
LLLKSPFDLLNRNSPQTAQSAQLSLDYDVEAVQDIPARQGKPVMKRKFVLIMALLAASASAMPQDTSPQLLRQAAHCLVTDSPDLRKLLHENRKELNLGYFVDDKSYPGEQALYVVDYAGSKFEKGLAYVFFVRQKDHRRVLRVENNASFIRKKKKVEFLENPVGGVWTQEHMEEAIDRIGQDSMFIFSVKAMREPFPDVSCESYADSH